MYSIKFYLMYMICIFYWIISVNGFGYNDPNCNNIYIEPNDSNPIIETDPYDEGNDIVDIQSYIIWLIWFGWFMGGLFCLGFLKGILGLFIQRIGVWGMDKIIPHPHVLCEYRERNLRDRCVIHDDTGWPINPDTYKRTVRVLSLPIEFLMNIIFFIAFPLVHLVKFLWWLGHCWWFKKQEPEECYCEWVNTNCCACNAETKHLLRRKKSKTSNSSNSKQFGSKSYLKPKNGTKPKVQQYEESESQPTSYDETNMDQETEDTKYVLNELNKSKLNLNNPISNFSTLNERCDPQCSTNSGRR